MMNIDIASLSKHLSMCSFAKACFLSSAICAMLCSWLLAPAFLHISGMNLPASGCL